MKNSFTFMHLRVLPRLSRAHSAAAAITSLQLSGRPLTTTLLFKALPRTEMMTELDSFFSSSLTTGGGSHHSDCLSELVQSTVFDDDDHGGGDHFSGGGLLPPISSFASADVFSSSSSSSSATTAAAVKVEDEESCQFLDSFFLSSIPSSSSKTSPPLPPPPTQMLLFNATNINQFLPSMPAHFTAQTSKSSFCSKGAFRSFDSLASRRKACRRSTFLTFCWSSSKSWNPFR